MVEKLGYKPENNAEDVADEAVWMAFKKSTPRGMGFMHVDAVKKLTKDKLLSIFKKKDNGEITYFTDYVAGRMMKLGLVVKGGEIEYVGQPSGRPPHPDYQSWAEYYTSANDLLECADLELTQRLEDLAG